MKTNKVRLSFLIWVFLGLLLLAAALFLTWGIKNRDRASLNYCKSVVEEWNTIILGKGENRQNGNSQDEKSPLYQRHPEIPMPAVTIRGESWIALLEDEHSGGQFPILNHWADEITDENGSEIDVAGRYQGSIYQNDMVLFGADTDSSFSFLKSLQYEECIRITDLDGNYFRFALKNLEKLKETDLEKISSAEYDLSLLTRNSFSGEWTVYRFVQVS